MKLHRVLLILFFVATCAGYAAEKWKVIDEGFRFSLPADWNKKSVHGIDSHVGDYRGKNASLEFDEVAGLGYTQAEAQKVGADFRKKEADKALLSPQEEIWRIDGRIGQFTTGKLDPKIYGKREYPNVATLFVPYEEVEYGAYLSVHVFFDREDQLPTVRKILESFTWKKWPPRNSQ